MPYRFMQPFPSTSRKQRISSIYKVLNEDAKKLLAKDYSQVRQWVIRQYEGLKEFTIKTTLKKARTKIYISCDLWTSPNSIVILGVTA
jgi:hypothetical protein